MNNFLTGYEGHNIPMDLHMEHLNGYLKEAFRRLRSNLNRDTAGLVGRSMNNVRKLINTAEESLESATPRSSRKKPSIADDVKKLAEELVKANVLVETKSRCYQSFKYFNSNALDGLDFDDMKTWISEYETRYKRVWMPEALPLNKENTDAPMDVDH